ncbi:U6 snRNA phosphodiesterase Usb1 [Xylaria acuta]|nr:U6 snRNA phosphodiesterase Usb1 [Xylaria acuta]
MGLVDYSSDSSESDETARPQTKRQKTSDNQTINSSAAKSELPPLPSAFYDLYASTVRVSASDDPALHQGRKRVNPHKVGNWPSHLYIEWHPTPTERTILAKLLSNLQSSLTSSPSSSTNPITITSFLTSDLGAPQPLHISLSRPIVLSTSQKETFLSGLESSIRSSGVAPFELAPAGVEWHRTAESARSFLVLRVGSTRRNSGGSRAGEETKPKPINPQLAALLRRANALVTAFGQPALYAFANSSSSSDNNDNSNNSNSNSNNTSKKPGSTTANNGGSKEVDTDAEVEVDNAFHISVAWSFAAPSAELRRLTEEAFIISTTGGTLSPSRDGDDEGKPSPDGGEKGADEESPTTATTTTTKDIVSAMRVRVDGVKAKIGNVVTHVPLPDGRRRRNDGSSEGGRGLFGI